MWRRWHPQDLCRDSHGTSLHLVLVSAPKRTGGPKAALCSCGIISLCTPQAPKADLLWFGTQTRCVHSGHSHVGACPGCWCFLRMPSSQAIPGMEKQMYNSGPVLPTPHVPEVLWRPLLHVLCWCLAVLELVETHCLHHILFCLMDAVLLWGNVKTLPLGSVGHPVLRENLPWERQCPPVRPLSPCNTT